MPAYGHSAECGRIRTRVREGGEHFQNLTAQDRSGSEPFGNAVASVGSILRWRDFDITVRHIAPIAAQNRIRTRRQSAIVNPAPPETWMSRATIMFPPSKVPTFPGLSIPTTLISFVSASTTRATIRLFRVPMKNRRT